MAAAQMLPMPAFRAPSDSVGRYIRLGDTGHRQLADLHAGGRFSPKRTLVDASRLLHQTELVRALRASGTVTLSDLRQLHDAKGGRRLISCADRNCCLHGFTDMVANPKRHGLYQRAIYKYSV
jgi:hypothetical protein